MNVDQLLACSEVLGTMAENFANMPDDKKDAFSGALFCTIARSYVIEYAKHLADGMDSYDALAATARGSIAIPPSAATVLQVLIDRPKQ